MNIIQNNNKKVGKMEVDLQDQIAVAKDFIKKPNGSTSV